MRNRYDRNILIKGFGREGQEKLSRSKVLVIGAGGLGSPVLLYLAAAGVGTLGIVDYDDIEITNLQRQIIHATSDLGTSKTASAAEKIWTLNPHVHLNLYPGKYRASNASSLIRGYDFIIDCCDNYATKFLINDACVSEEKPYSHGAALALRGEAMTWLPGHACYRCVFDTPPEEGTAPTSSEAGILGPIAGIIGSIQATEAIKYLTGIGELLTDRLLTLDGAGMQFLTLKVQKNKGCLCNNIE